MAVADRAIGTISYTSQGSDVYGIQFAGHYFEWHGG